MKAKDLCQLLHDLPEDSIVYIDTETGPTVQVECASVVHYDDQPQAVILFDRHIPK